MMNVDVVGRVDNLSLPRTKGLLPVQEAVINSIQAVEDFPEPRVQVVIERDRSQGQLGEERSIEPIVGFRVVDNGVGFDDRNFGSFQTSDTTLKADSGGKGIGRFLWLKAFDRVRIDSHFDSPSGRTRREFDFVLSPDAIEEHSVSQVSSDLRQTTVVLSGLKERYQQYMPKRTSIIAQRILEHCLSFFILEMAPAIEVIDADEEDTISLNALYDSHISGNAETVRIELNGAEFRADIIRYPTTSESNHRVSYCAHSREVRTESLSDAIPLLSRRLSDDDGSEFVYLVYVSGEYLDTTVNQERTSFVFDSGDGDQAELGLAEVIPFTDIRRAVASEIQAHAERYLQPIRDEHHQSVTKFIRTSAPEYRTVLKYRSEELDTIPPGTTGDKLDLALHKINQQIEREIKEEGVSLLATKSEDLRDLDDYKRQYNDIIDKVTDVGQARLSSYVIHRKLILSLFEKRLGLADSDKYALEEAVHEILFPLRTTSDDVDYGRHNLWMIDERLSYHFFLASDKQLASVDLLKSDSRERPDLLIFNEPLAFRMMSPRTRPS